MKCILGVVLGLALTLADNEPAQSAGLMTARRLPAFPGAEGFGALATGGRGGVPYRVTSLADAGPGTFRDAVSRPKRIIVFDVGGLIRLRSNVACSDNLTILGQTAPGEGIALYGHSLSLSGCTNIIVRYLRIREGIDGSRGRCSVNLAGGSHIIFDHISVEWGRWDCLGLTVGSHDITVQNCIIGQGIAPQRFGALVDSVSNITLSHNLWIDNHSRNPKAKGTVQYINNVVYNWGVNGLVGGHSHTDHQLDAIGNYFIEGPDSNDRFVGLFTATDHVFQEGNYFDSNRDGRLNGRRITNANFAETGGPATFVNAPLLHPPVAVTIDPVKVVWQTIVTDAGCSLHRDAVDRWLIAELISRGTQGRIISSERELGSLGELIGGPPAVSRAHAGMPDSGRKAHGLNVQAVDIVTGNRDQKGYTRLEQYANKLVAGRFPRAKAVNKLPRINADRSLLTPETAHH